LGDTGEEQGDEQVKPMETRRPLSRASRGLSPFGGKAIHIPSPRSGERVRERGKSARVKKK